MYSGTTFRTKSGRMMGVHQRIDRVARFELAKLLPKRAYFPNTHDILHFEGLNGPDGIKRKSPGQDEPWHYLDPTKGADEVLHTMISDHMFNLSRALADDNRERAAFEAAWLAHAITDGLTPAHHYPLEEKLEELRGGKGLESRNTAKEKILLPGKNRREQFRNNWEYWGVKGVMTTHFSFELGIATTIAPSKLPFTEPTADELARLRKDGYMAVFNETLQQVAQLELYQEFYRNGWTRRMANDTKRKLIPTIIRAVCLAWYQAALDADALKKAAN